MRIPGFISDKFASGTKIGKGLDLLVIMPTFNHEQYLAQAIESVLSQKTSYTYQLTVLNDASTDGTEDILRKYQYEYPERVTVFSTDENKGSGKHVLRDLNLHLQSRYVATLEGDDYWCDDTKIQTQIEFLDQNKNFSGVSHHVGQITKGSDDSEMSIIKPSLSEWTLDDMLSGAHFTYCHSSSFVRRNYFNNILPKGFSKMNDILGIRFWHLRSQPRGRSNALTVS